MPIHDRILRGISKGVSALGGFAGDIFGQAVQAAPAVLGGILQQQIAGAGGGPPTSIPTGFNPSLQAQAELARLFGLRSAVPSVPTTFVPGQPLGGALTLPGRGDPMAILGNTALPGGAPVIQAGLGEVFGGIAGGLLGSGLFGGGQAMTPQGAVCPTLFRPGMAALVPVRSFHITNPSTGKEVWYRNVGQPILFSGDLTVCKRVEKVARRARRVTKR